MGSKDGALANEILIQKIVILHKSFIAKLANNPIKVGKYKYFKISNGWLEKSKKMTIITRQTLNMFHFYHLIM